MTGNFKRLVEGRKKKKEDLIQSWPGLTCRFLDFEIMAAYLK